MGIRQAWGGQGLSLLLRTENEGMDLAAHNVTLEYVKKQGKLKRYKFFIFLNSSAMGPFYPTYMPASWHWTHAYTAHLKGNVHGVSSSLVCLPEEDAGGPGPRMESWAFATDQVGLQVLTSAGALNLRSCKLCSGNEGIVVGGEYGISRSLLDAGLNFWTLMYKYQGAAIDWSDPSHWGCNNNVHPSRHGTYDGISFHPFETVFVKSSWHVADPYTARYSTWRLKALADLALTDGSLDHEMYRYAVSMEAQEDHDVQRCYNVLNRPA